MTIRTSCYVLVTSASVMFNPWAVENVYAHKSIGVNGTVLLQVREADISVDYELECGALTAIDVRPKMDLNSDGAISVADLLVYLGEFGCEVNCTADFDSDGLVNIEDLLGFLSVFGDDCPN